MLSIIILLPALATAIPLIKRQTQPDIITITDAQTSGNGCPQGSVSTSLSPDGTVVTFGFDSFQTYIGPTAAQADKSKACQIHLDLLYPGGFQYAVVDSVYHGYARLDAGVTGTFLSTYYFSQNAAQTSTTRSSISGPDWLLGNVYTKEDQVQSTATIWSPCGDTGILNVNNRVALTSTNSTQTGELSDDDATVAFTHQVHVSWQPCVLGSSSGSGSGFQTGGGGTVVTPGKREPQIYTIGPGSTTTTPGDTGGGTTTITIGEDGEVLAREPQTWTIGPGGTTTITPGGGGGITIITPGED